MPTLALTFLAPGAGIMAAAIGGSALLFLYFLKLRRKPMRVSSTLFWAQATNDLQVNAPFRWLRASWLLLLQALLLACFALALARPALDLEGPPARRVAIVIDRSASMGARDGSPDEGGAARTRLEEAKALAIERISLLPSDARAMVVAFGRRAEILASLTSDRALLRNTIQSISPSDESGDLAGALEVVGPALAGTSESGDDLRPTVALFSDGAFAQFDEATAQAAAALGGATIEFERAGPMQTAVRDNVGIVALAARRDYEDPALVRLFVRVQSVAPEEVDVAITCSLNGESLSSTPLRISGAGDIPGEAAHTFEFAAPDGGVVTVAVVRSDVLPADDTASIVLKRPRLPRILLVQPNVPTSVVDFLAADALEALSPSELRVVTIGQYEALPASDIAGYSLVVFDRSRPSALPDAPSISFGANLPIPGLGLSEFPQDDPDGAPTTFAFWQRTHPVMRYAALGGVLISRPLQMTLPSPSGDGPALSSEIIASGRAGPLIGLLEQAGVRRLIVAFELGDSRWWQDASFPVFLKNAVDYLTLSGDEQAGVVYRPGDPVSIGLAPGASAIRVSGPISFERPASGDGRRRLTIGALPLVGVYRIQGARPGEEVAAVSMLDPFESEIATRDALLVGGRSIEAAGSGGSAPREIWHWLVLAALALLTIEWIAYSWRMRV